MKKKILTPYESEAKRRRRDMFASAALRGMLGSAPLCDRTKIDKDLWARIAFKWADAMLKASKVGKG